MEPRPKTDCAGHIIVKKEEHHVDPSLDLLEQAHKRLVTLRTSHPDWGHRVADACTHVEDAIMSLEMEKTSGSQAE